MGVDPLLNSGRPNIPQSWNRYAYGLNNPLRFIDPTGLFDWDESAGGELTDEELDARGMDMDVCLHDRKAAKKAMKFRKKFRDGLAAAQAAADDSGSQMVEDAVDAYGTENDSNGVLVGVQSGHGGVAILNDNDTISVKIGSDISGGFLAATIAHEGDHVAKAEAWMAAGEGSVGNLNHYEREQSAWNVGAIVAQTLGMNSFAPYSFGSNFQVWNKSWNAADIETKRSRGVTNILNEMKIGNTDAVMQKRYSDEHQHKD
jgi:hypothetical protein